MWCASTRSARPRRRRSMLFVRRELAVVSPVRLLDVLEDDMDLVGRRLADVDHGLGDGGGDIPLLLIGAAGEPLHCDVRHFEYLSRDWSGRIITRAGSSGKEAPRRPDPSGPARFLLGDDAAASQRASGF